MKLYNVTMFDNNSFVILKSFIDKDLATEYILLAERYNLLRKTIGLYVTEIDDAMRVCFKNG